MSVFNFLKSKKVRFLTGSVILCSTMVYLITSILFFPKEINILAGSVNSINLKSPFSGTIEAENISVLKVNNQPVKENIKIDLGKEVSIETQEEASLNMTLKLFGIPMRTVKVEALSNNEVIPCGMTVGVVIDTDGVLVLGTGYVNGDDGGVHRPCEGILKSGDMIMEVNGQKINSNDELTKAVECSDNDLKVKIRRDDQIIETNIESVKSLENGKNKIGLWVRDSTKGIGTITYYDPNTNSFAALGHGIMDIDTKKLMQVRTGKIMTSEITSVKKGKKGSPGELIGDIDNDIIGTVAKNSVQGIFGEIKADSLKKMPAKTMSIALQGEVHVGPAKIRSNIMGTEIGEYDVFIESINKYSNDDSKGIVIKIVDPKLLQATGGIVQGMSGSPIIQDGKLIGAVTHVFVQEPTKGYGIFIENMMKNKL